MQARYIGKDGVMGLKHNYVYDIYIERPKNYYTYVLKAYSENQDIQVNYASVISIKQNWKITDIDIDMMLKE